MAYGFLDIAITPSVRAVQADNGVEALWADMEVDRACDRFTEAEAAFVAARDHFYIGSVSETGWPYVQHRGGPIGFLRAVDERTLAFADFRGNRQYLTLGNVAANDRVCLFVIDYLNRARLKIYGHMTTQALDADPALTAALLAEGYKGHPERIVLITLETFDWNCPQHITPRFSAQEVAAALSTERGRIAELEAENLALRARLAALGG